MLKLIRGAVAPLSSFAAAGCMRSLDTEPILKQVVPVNCTHTHTLGAIGPRLKNTEVIL